MLALDLFAGTGWGVACQRLGIEELGVELWEPAVRTRDAAGMATILRDVWTGLGRPTDERWGYDLLIASPPCQTFSVAGGGAGRRALDEVLELLTSGAYLHPHHLRALGERHDPRTALVLTPLAYVARDLPRFVVLEQVPPVLPLWEAMAVQLRANGYSVVTGILNAEQYGVPQTRKRAILIARRDGIPAVMPTPTHSRYYSQEPDRLDNHGVGRWVSMAEALGWGMAARPSMTVTGGGTATGGAEPFGTMARRGMARELDLGRWIYRSNYSSHGDLARRVERTPDEPAPTVTSRQTHWAERGTLRISASTANDWRRVTPQEAAVLQSYPADFPFRGTKGQIFQQIGNAVPPRLAEAILGSLIRP